MLALSPPSWQMEPTEFTFVRIPAIDDEPPEEIKATASSPGDSLLEILKLRFAGGAVKNAEGLRAEYGDAVDEKMDALNSIASQGSVEVFALVRPSSTTRPVPHAGTYFYLDEMGVLKGLPVNRRASQIASACGLKVESPFLGDIYVGRVCVNPSPMRNASFGLAELSSDAVWLRSAPSENEQYQMAMGDYEKAAKEKTQEGKARASETSSSSSTAAATPEGPPPAGSWKWAQTSEDLEVTVALPSGTTRQQLKVDVAVRSLRVALKVGGAEPLLDLALYAAVRPDESTWTLNVDKANGATSVQVRGDARACTRPPKSRRTRLFVQTRASTCTS